MKRKIKAGKAEITLSNPRLWTNPNKILICVGHCKPQAFATRADKTVTFFPVIGPQKPKLMRKVLDAVGNKDFKIGSLEMFLAVFLAKKRFVYDKSKYDKYLKCYDFKVFLRARYVRCDAVIKTAGGKIKFRIDIPVGAFQEVEGKPKCCEDKTDVADVIGKQDEPPAKEAGQAAKDLYEEALKRERVKESDMLKEMMDAAERSGFGKKKKKVLKPLKKLKLDYDFEDWDRKDDKPVIKIKPKWGF